MPSCDNKKLYEDILEVKKSNNKELLEGAKDLVLERYEFYEKNTSNLEDIVPVNLFSTETKSALISCYGHNVTFNEIRPRILKTSDKCPYCQIDRASEIEHYFDKSTYPEYSVFIPNLIPCCSICNKAKGTKTLTSSNERIFIHFYFDTLPSYQFLFIKFDLITEDSDPSVEVSLQFKENDDMESIIKNHFQALNLLNTYKEECGRKLELFLSECQYYPYTFVMTNIEAKYQSSVKILGLNHFETCFYQGLCTSESFIQVILKQKSVAGNDTSSF